MKAKKDSLQKKKNVSPEAKMFSLSCHFILSIIA